MKAIATISNFLLLLLFHFGQQNRCVSESLNTTNSSTTQTTPEGGTNNTNVTSTDDTTDLPLIGSGATVSPLLNWPQGKCIDNLTWIMDDIILKGPFEKKKYNICPNKTYELGLYENLTCCAIGSDNMTMHHPFTIRSYSEFICGDDGKSSNNCVLLASDYHVLSTPFEFPGEPSKGVTFRGFTFEKAGQFQIILGNEGDFLFDDCIFKDHAAYGVMGLVFNPTLRRLRESHDERRMTKYGRTVFESITEQLQDREMVTSSTDPIALTRRCMVTVNNSMFVNNTLGLVKNLAQPGIIMVDPTFHDLVIQNTVFMNNNFFFPGDITEGFAVRVGPENTLKIESSCFIDNQFFGGGIIVMNNTVVEGLTNNYVSSSLENDLTCSLAFLEVEGTCIAADATSCPRYQVTNPDSQGNLPNQTNTGVANTTGTSAASYSMSMFASLFALLASTVAIL